MEPARETLVAKALRMIPHVPASKQRTIRDYCHDIEVAEKNGWESMQAALKQRLREIIQEGKKHA